MAASEKTKESVWEGSEIEMWNGGQSFEGEYLENEMFVCDKIDLGQKRKAYDSLRV